MGQFAIDDEPCFIPPDEIVAILRHPIAPRTYDFDAVALRAAVARSYSITFWEKVELINSFPRLSVVQAETLFRVFTEERQKLVALWKRHYESRLKSLQNLEEPAHRDSFHVVQ